MSSPSRLVAVAAAAGRTAFQRWLVHDHKNSASAITAIAVDNAGQKMYIGTSDGQLEEYRIVADFSNAHVSISARKQVGRKPVVVVLYLVAARCLALVCDNALLLLDVDSLEGSPVAGVRGVTAVAADQQSTMPPTLAIASKPSKKSVRVTVFEVYAASSGSAQRHTAMVSRSMELPEPGTVTHLAWAGRNLLLGAGLRYMLLRVEEGQASVLFEINEEAMSPMALLGLPGTGQAVLLMNEVGVVCDSSGAPSSSALSFPSPPLAMAAAGLFVLAICSDGVHVYDRSSGEWVQRLSFGEGLRPAPGQTIHAASNARGSSVAVAGQRKVWLLQPVALEYQARQLLQQRRFEQLDELAAAAAATGATWVDTALAQAGMLLLQELRFAEAVRFLSRTSLSVFQPLQLFPLFPDYTAPWSSASTGAEQRFWGLAAPLTPLEGCIRAALLARSRGGDGGGVAGIDDCWLEKQVAEQGAAARQCIIAYLMQARTREGVAALDGVDTLLVRLLCCAGDAGQLHAFAQQRNQVVVAEAEAALLAEGQRHALALLCAQHGLPTRALDIWRELAEGRPCVEQAGGRAKGSADAHGSCGSGLGGSAGAAVEHAAALMQDESSVPAKLALENLPWLLTVAPPAALRVLRSRVLPAEAVLGLLRGRDTGLRLAYLQHLVADCGSKEARYHTELALVAAAVCLDALASPRINGGGPLSPSAGPSGASAHELLRLQLHSHLEASALYDVRTVLAAVAGSQLWQEQVVLYRKLGDHAAALRVLALTLGDMRAAEDYCATHAGQGGYLLLLDMLLSPGTGRPPLFREACHLLAAQGAHLDPLRVLSALPEDMPLADALPLLQRMLRERTHRHRSALLHRNIERAQNLAIAAQRAETMGRRVVVTEERACRLCHMRIGTKMFAVFPSGLLVCFKCYRRCDPALSAPSSLRGADLHAPMALGQVSAAALQEESYG